MSKKKFFILIISLSILLSGCQKKNIDKSQIKLSNHCLNINVEIGSNYFLKKFGILKSNHTPQTVIWIEDENGKYIDTIFITDKASKAGWGKDEVERPSCFPIWSHNRGIETSKNYFMPTKSKSMPDSITGATPKTDFNMSFNLPENFKPGKYKINLEVNSSYDYNKYYTNKTKNEYYHEFDGQPSLLWSGIIEIGSKQKETHLQLIGHGDLNGKTGEISEDLSKITTAKNMIKSVNVKYLL